MTATDVDWLNRQQCEQARLYVLREKLNGHYAYYGITSNFDRIAQFFHMAKHVWRTALARRSQQRLPWVKMQKLLERFPLPAPRIVHQYGT